MFLGIIMALIFLILFISTVCTIVASLEKPIINFIDHLQKKKNSFKTLEKGLYVIFQKAKNLKRKDVITWVKTILTKNSKEKWIFMGLSNKVCKFPFIHGTLTLYLLIHHEEGAGS